MTLSIVLLVSVVRVANTPFSKIIKINYSIENKDVI